MTKKTKYSVEFITLADAARYVLKGEAREAIYTHCKLKDVSCMSDAPCFACRYDAILEELDKLLRDVNKETK